MENFQFNKTLFDNIRRSLIFTENKGKYNYIMVQRIGDTLVVLLGKSYFIRRQKCS